MSNDERNEFPLTNSQPNFKSNTIYTSREGATDATSMKTNFAIDAANRTVRNADKNKVFYNTAGFNSGEPVKPFGRLLQAGLETGLLRSACPCKLWPNLFRLG